MVAIVGMYIYLYVLMKENSAICPNCGGVWEHRIYIVIFTVYFFDNVLLKCPNLLLEEI